MEETKKEKNIFGSIQMIMHWRFAFFEWHNTYCLLSPLLIFQISLTTASLTLAFTLVLPKITLWLQCACVHTHKTALTKWSPDFAPM